MPEAEYRKLLRDIIDTAAGAMEAPLDGVMAAVNEIQDLLDELSEAIDADREEAYRE